MDYTSVTYLKLDVWKGSGKWYSDQKLTPTPSDGSFEIGVSLIDIPGGGTGEDIERIRKTEACQKALEFQVQNQQVIFQEIMDAAQKEYDLAVADKDAYDPETVDLYLPEVHNRDELKELIAPLSVHISFTNTGEVESVGYGFSCSWEEEHGFGVRFKDLEVVDFGYEDIAY